MVGSVDSKGMTQHQVSLLEHALRQVSKIEQASWGVIPMELHPSFAKYMCRDAWTGLSDVMALREAALLIVRDAITRTGEFADES